MSNPTCPFCGVEGTHSPEGDFYKCGTPVRPQFGKEHRQHEKSFRCAARELEVERERHEATRKEKDELRDRLAEIVRIVKAP